MLCTEVAFLKGGQLISEGRIPDLQRRLGLGDDYFDEKSQE